MAVGVKLVALVLIETCINHPQLRQLTLEGSCSFPTNKAWLCVLVCSVGRKFQIMLLSSHCLHLSPRLLHRLMCGCSVRGVMVGTLQCSARA
eukprot:1157541-Pelagomonas_calceolata.AAC.2